MSVATLTVLDRLRLALHNARQRHPGFTEEMSEEALLQILSLLGGESVLVPRTTRGDGRPGRPRALADESQVIAAAISSDESTTVVARKHGISRATLYRIMKR